MTLVAARFADLLKRIPASAVGLNASIDDFGTSGNMEKGKGREENEDALREVGKWLSDWHLLAFLDGVGIFESVRSILSFFSLVFCYALVADVKHNRVIFNSWLTLLFLEKLIISPPCSRREVGRRS